MTDPAAYLQDPQLLAAREAAASSGQLATDYATAASSLPQKLTQAVKEKLDYNRGLIEEKNKAFETYTTAAPAAREKYADIWDPFTREKLVAQERATAYTPYANSSDILKTSMGSMNDIINNAVGAFSGAVQAAQGASQAARQKYQDAFEWAKTMADIELSKQKTSGSGTGINVADILALIEAMKNKNDENRTPPKTTSPFNLSPSYSSPGLTYESGPSIMGEIQAPKLLDPGTGITYFYSGENDPDYIEDKNKGFITP